MRTKNILILASATLLAACGNVQRNGTYDTIKETVAAAAAKPANAAPLDDAVSNALLPPVATLASQMPKARQALEERFNVSFNNVPAQQFFNSLVLGTRYNMLVSPEVSGNITANLKDVTMAEALDAVRELYGYDYKIDGSKIFIRPLTMQSRIFRVNYLLGRRASVSNLRVTSTSVGNFQGSSTGQNGQNSNNQNNGQQQGTQGATEQVNPDGSVTTTFGQSDSAGVRTSETADFWRELKESVTAIVGSNKDGRTIVVSPQSGVIVVRAMPAELRNVEEYLKAAQLSVERQVILEAKILEVELNDSYQSGINWASFASFKGSHDNRVSTGLVSPGASLQPLPFAGGQPPTMADARVSASTGFNLTNLATTPGSLFGLAFQTSNFAALMSFLESQGTVHVLSSPRVTAMNNQKSLLKIGSDEFFVTGVSATNTTNAGSNTTIPTVQLSPFFSGVVLDVTPQIDDAGNIMLHVHPSVSQVSTLTKDINLGTLGSLKLPLAASDTSEMDMMVRGPNGRVVALGGLMRESSSYNNSGVPGTGSIPVLGSLFGSKQRTVQKRELVVLIKPTIVDGTGNMSQEFEEAGRRLENLNPRSLERK